MEAQAQRPMDPQEFQKALREILTDQARAKNMKFDAFALNIIAARGGDNFTKRFGPATTTDFTVKDLGRVQDATDHFLLQLASHAVPSPDGSLKITANMVTNFFKGFCDRFPDFFPFCV
jgi:hypothetical protein